MKIAILGLLVSATISSAYADYTCIIKVNSERGFDVEMEATATPAEVGGKLFLTSARYKVLRGIISEVGSINRNDHSEKLEALLDYFGAEDVSGITEEDLEKVTSVSGIATKKPNGEETILFQFFNGETQIGGSIFLAGKKTSCLPK